MNFKPLRDYSEHDVINMFAFTGSSATKGSAVSLTVGFDNSGLPNEYVHNLAATPNAVKDVSNRVFSPRYSAKAKCGFTASGEKPFGLLVYDVRETDDYGTPLAYDKKRKLELQCVVSGEAVPIVRKGLFRVGGYSGTAGVNSGVKASVLGNGQLQVCALNDAACFGRFLGAADSEGYALLVFNCWE